MKKLFALIVTGCMLFGALGTAAAIDVKVSGVWDFTYGHYNGMNHYNNKRLGTSYDKFFQDQRVRTQIDFIASETLSAKLHFEIGDLYWGRSDGGSNDAPLDADRTTTFEVKWAYLDWTIPGTQIKTRQGIQPIALPMSTGGNPVFTGDVAGISFNVPFNQMIGLTGFWVRPYDVSVGDSGARSFDEMDVFGLTLPITTSALKITPWAMAATIGSATAYNNRTGTPWYQLRGRNIAADARENQSFAWWLGVAGEVRALDPFFINFDAIMGGQNAKKGTYGAWINAPRPADVPPFAGDPHPFAGEKKDYSSFGYFLDLEVGYKFAWGKPSLLAWYASGDNDRNKRYGSLPGITDDTGWTAINYSMSGRHSIDPYQTITSTGFGTWGIALNLKDVSFVDKLTHDFQLAFFRGTNSGDNIVPGQYPFSTGMRSGPAKAGGFYLVTSDSVYQASIMNKYQATKELAVMLDLAWIHLNASKQRETTGTDFNAKKTSDYYFANVIFQYRF